MAEQNRVDLSWELLIQHKYVDLQRYKFATKEEYIRFRQLVVNTVLAATGIFDSELKALWTMRWDRAFHSDEVHGVFDSGRQSSTVRSESDDSEASISFDNDASENGDGGFPQPC